MSKLNLKGFHPLLFFIFLLFILPHALLRPLYQLGVSIELYLLHVELLACLRDQGKCHRSGFHHIRSTFLGAPAALPNIRSRCCCWAILLSEAELRHLPPDLGHWYHYFATSCCPVNVASLCLGGALCHHRCKLVFEIVHLLAICLIYDLLALPQYLLFLKSPKLPVLFSWLTF